MGISTYSDICQNVCELGRISQEPGIDEVTGAYVDITCPNGEVWKTNKYRKCGKRKRLYAAAYKKGEAEIFLVNSDPYSAVGEVWMVVFGEDATAVKEFVKDVEPLFPGLRVKIEAEDCVSYTT